MDETFTNAYAGQTVLNPIGLAMAIIMGVMTITLPRKYAIWPFLIMACFVSQAQRIYLLGMNFDLIRVLVVCAGIRVFAKGEQAWFRMNRLDIVVLAWGLAATIIPVVRIGPSVLVNRLGNLFDIFGMYFLFRCLIRSLADIYSIGRCLVVLSIPVSAFFAAEFLTGRNVFAAFGGVPPITPIRDGRLRCQGAFSHSILAGSFWAASMPLLAMGWWRNDRFKAGVAVMAGLFMVLASASATPVTSLMVAVIGIGCFRIRKKMLWVRIGLVLTLIGLHMVMKAPVWHLIARLGSLGGSSWHRFALIDGCITHANEWLVMGSNLGSAHWGYFTYDVANFFIVECLHGGMVLLILFILVISTAFGCVGRILKRVEHDRAALYTTWAIGLCVLIHALNLFGVSYFGQIWCSWYLTLAIVGSLYQVSMNRAAAPAPVRKRAAQAVVNGVRIPQTSPMGAR